MRGKPANVQPPGAAKKFPLHPKAPDRTCWGCDKFCAASSMRCGNGSDRTQHPVELLGDDWYEHGDWGLDLAEGDEAVEPGEPGQDSAAARAS
jgi:hypothetical protein